MKLDQLHDSIRLALIVIARFGFINKSLFFKYLTPNGKTQKYELWKRFLKSEFIIPYKRIGVAENYYSLSKIGYSVLKDYGLSPVSKSHPLHFEHDEIAMGFAIACERKKIIKSNWCPDKELRELKPTDVQKRFGLVLTKLPDLIFNLETFSKLQICCALEVERSRKSKHRYDSIVLNYLKDKNFGLILVAYKDQYVKKSILQSVKKLGYPQSSKPFIFCRIGDVLKNPTGFEIEVGSNLITFEKYIENIRLLSRKNPEEMTEKDSGKKFGQKVVAA